MKNLVLKIILSIFLFLIFNHANAQNLVENGSFEKHGTIDFRERYATQPNDWETSKTLLCDCEYEEKVKIHTHGFNEHTCINSIGASDGCSMMKLVYAPKYRCKPKDNFSGSAAYLISDLSKTLEIGKFYKVSYSMYYASTHNTLQDSSILDNLGFILTNKNPYQGNNCLIPTRAIVTDNFKKNQWFKTEKIIKPSCELNFLTIGIFRNKSWTSYKDDSGHHATYYFIDDVSVVEISESEVINPKSTTYFCNSLPEPPTVLSKIDSTDYHIYFSTNEAIPLDFKRLEEMARFAKAKPETVFLISGHTDNVGMDNFELSKNRVTATVNYLIQQHEIPKYRLITAHFGATKPIAPNDTEVNRAKNRRVTIEATPIWKSKALYRQALTELENGNKAEALRLFRGWEINEKDSEKILAYFDIKIDAFRQDKRWGIIDKAIKKSYDKYSKAQYAFTLDSLYCEDQKYRRLNTYVQDLAGYLSIIDTSDWNYPNITDVEWRRKDSLICLRLQPLLIQNSFPKISEVGKRAAKAAAVILIHSHDFILIKQYLPIMEKYCKEGEADWGYFAMLYDKYCTIRNQPQRYGTQYLSNPENPSEMLLAKLENPSKINERREMIGLSPLSLEVIGKALED